jgi:CRISPR-associated endoribonuclease Cas6
MRFAVELSFKGKPPFLIPNTYRRNIIGLIKEAIKSSDPTQELFNKYWGNCNTQSVKPFTFFLSVPDVRYIDLDDGRFMKINDNILKLHISSSDSNFISILQDWLLNSSKSFTLFNYNMDVRGINLKNIKKINSSFAKFKILSPVIVRNTAAEGMKRKCMGYLSCNDVEFEDSLAHSILTLCRRFLHNENIYRNDIDIDASLCVSSIIYHYMETIPVSIGIIGIKANEDVLKLIYNAGLGARRSQGFGMVDLLSETNSESMAVMEELA